MTATWVLVADGGRARILEIGGARRDLREVEDLVNVTGRSVPPHNRNTRRNARSADASDVTAGPTPPVESIERQVERFVSDVAAHLDRARAERRFRGLCVIAAPRLLALLRRTFSDETRELVEQEIPRDLSESDVDDIDAYVRGDRA